MGWAAGNLRRPRSRAVRDGLRTGGGRVAGALISVRSTRRTRSWPSGAARSRRSRSSRPCGRSAQTSPIWRSTRIPRARPRRPPPAAAPGRPASTSPCCQCRRGARPGRGPRPARAARGRHAAFRAGPGGAGRRVACALPARAMPAGQVRSGRAAARALGGERARHAGVGSARIRGAPGEALGLSIEALMEDCGRHAAETRARAVHEHLPAGSPSGLDGWIEAIWAISSTRRRASSPPLARTLQTGEARRWPRGSPGLPSSPSVDERIRWTRGSKNGKVRGSERGNKRGSEAYGDSSFT
jgi:hypothetical protein